MEQTDFNTSLKGLESGVKRVRVHPASGEISATRVPRGRIPQYTYRVVKTDVTGKHNPERDGLRGWAIGNPYASLEKRKHNDFFGPQTIWTSKTLKGAHRFYDELALKDSNIPRGQHYDIYRIKNRNYPWSKAKRRGVDVSSPDYPDFGAARDLKSVDWTDTNIHQRSLEHKRAYQEVVKHNREVVLEGPIPPEDIKLVAGFSYTPEEASRRRRQPHMAKLNINMLNFINAKSKISKAWKDSIRPTETAASQFTLDLSNQMEAFYNKQKEQFDKTPQELDIEL